LTFLKGIRRKAGNFILRRNIRKLSRNKRFINLEDVNTIGVVFSLKDNDGFESINELLKELTARKKQIFAIGYIEKKKIPDHYLLRKGYNFFCMADLNWYFKPEPSFVSDFIEREFDLLINLSTDQAYPVEYIYALSKARFKTGKFFEGTDHSDLAIDTGQSRDTKYLAEQLTHYLQIINKRH
jgi:hypothetical protein